MVMEAPAVARAYVHDGSGRRLAALPEAVGNRTYRTGQPGQASYTMPAETETLALIELLDPRDGRLLVVESSYYPLTWVGPITGLRYSPATGEVTIEASSYEAVLQRRLLPTDCTIGGAAGGVFEQLVVISEAANAANLVLSPNVPSGPVIADTAFGDRSLHDALNLLSVSAEAEYWLTHDTARGVLTTTIHFGMRGVDRFADFDLVGGPNANISVRESRVSVDGQAHRLRAVAGARSVTESYSSRLRTERRYSTASPIEQALVGQVSRTIHGHDFSRAPTGGTVLTRGDQLQVLEAVRGDGDLAIAAEALLRRGRFAERAVDLAVSGHLERWDQCEPGDVLRLVLEPPHLVRGYDGPVRVLSSRPMEHTGELQLVLEVPSGD